MNSKDECILLNQLEELRERMIQMEIKLAQKSGP